MNPVKGKTRGPKQYISRVPGHAIPPPWIILFCGDHTPIIGKAELKKGFNTTDG